MIDPLILVPIALSVLSNLVAAAAWLYGWQSKKHTAQTTDLKALEARVQAQELELTAIRVNLLHIPSGTQVHELSIGIGDLRGDHKALYATVKAMGEQITTIAGTVRRIDDHMRDMAK